MNELTQENQPPKEVLTEVTSIAQEEARTGQKIPLPTPQEMVNNAVNALIANRRNISNIFGKLSKKATLRVLYASTDLPAEKVPVLFKSQEEIEAYKTMVVIERAKFTVMYYHVAKQMAEDQLKAKVSQESSDNNNVTNEGVQA